MRTLISAIAILSLAAMLASCSGGGGDSGGGGNTNYTIGGTVSGLSGSGLVLQNNGSDDLAITTNGTFTFATMVADGGGYTVTVKTQPSSLTQTCSASNNTGTIAGANVMSVSVVCSTNAYTVGGTVSGLSGSGLVLQINGGDDLTIAANGTFTFATMVADGAGYAVTVMTQPAGQTCTVANGSRIVAGANVTIVAVVCSTNPLPAPSAPINVSALSGAQKSTVSWDTVAGATSYNIYFANSTGVTKATGTTITGVTSPYQHLHLNTGTYYYVVTAVDANGESAESGEVSVPINLLAFVTSTTGNGNLGSWSDAGGKTGLAAADAICQARAVAAGFTGTFKAWISINGADAYCRIHDLPGVTGSKCGQLTLPVAAGPWVRTDGFPFGEAIDSLLTPTGKVYAPVRLDEFGNSTADGTIYFTNTQRDGTMNMSNPSSCSNWTSGVFNPSVFIGFGVAALTTDGWTTFTTSYCSANQSLLCMQVGAGPALPVFASTGKKIFITSANGAGNLGSWSGASGNTGINAGDAICQARATAAGLANALNFKAWLSDSTVNAKDRLSSNGPWVRLDGVPVANSKTDLTDGSIFTAVNLTETGVYIGLAGTRVVWTGTGSDGIKTTDTCNGWTDATTTYSGTRGNALSAGANWANYDVGYCNFTSAPLYCIED